MTLRPLDAPTKVIETEYVRNRRVGRMLTNRLQNWRTRHSSLIWMARGIAGATLIALLAHWHGVVR